MPPIFSLVHLAHLSQTDYTYLRSVVRRTAPTPYKLFRIRKRPLAGDQRYRVITIPAPALMACQRWISQNILRHAVPHHASTAFCEGQSPLEAARPHCGARWLIKVDVRGFFESLTEIDAYRAFLSLGYQPLVAFELARICTRQRSGANRPLGRH